MAHLAGGAERGLRPTCVGARAGAAARAPRGRAAPRLWRHRAGVEQSVAVDLRTAGLALKSNRLMTLDGKPVDNEWRGISGFYRTADDRWIQLHCNYPHHRDGVLARLRCTDDRAAVATAVAARAAADLEDLLVAESLPVAMVRNNEEWAAHPQSAAVAGLPLLDITRIGDAPLEPLRGGDRPLAGIKALDLTRVLAGPVAARTLAEHGATVMTVAGPHLPAIEEQIMDTGHGKLATHIDLRETAGRETLDNLIRNADIFSQAYRPGTLSRRGLSPERVAKLRPGIVYVDLCAWSHAGPWAPRRGFDSLVQSASAIAHEQGNATKPDHLPGQALDYISGYLGAFGAMTALLRRAEHGGSWLVRLSLAQTGRWISSLGRLPGTGALATPAITIDDIPQLMQISDTAWGRLGYMMPVAQLSATPGCWDRPVAPLGSHPPVWPN